MSSQPALHNFFFVRLLGGPKEGEDPPPVRCLAGQRLFGLRTIGRPFLRQRQDGQPDIIEAPHFRLPRRVEYHQVPVRIAKRGDGAGHAGVVVACGRVGIVVGEGDQSEEDGQRPQPAEGDRTQKGREGGCCC